MGAGSWQRRMERKQNERKQLSLRKHINGKVRTAGGEKGQECSKLKRAWVDSFVPVSNLVSCWLTSKNLKNEQYHKNIVESSKSYLFQEQWFMTTIGPVQRLQTTAKHYSWHRDGGDHSKLLAMWGSSTNELQQGENYYLNVQPACSSFP